MSLRRDEVDKIATLARLSLAEDEIVDYTNKLSAIIEMIDELQAVNTDAVTPMAHPLDFPQRLRVDEVTESDQREHFQSGAPEVEGGLYLVPRVIE